MYLMPNGWLVNGSCWDTIKNGQPCNKRGLKGWESAGSPRPANPLAYHEFICIRLPLQFQSKHHHTLHVARQNPEVGLEKDILDSFWINFGFCHITQCLCEGAEFGLLPLQLGTGSCRTPGIGHPSGLAPLAARVSWPDRRLP